MRWQQYFAHKSKHRSVPTHRARNLYSLELQHFGIVQMRCITAMDHTEKDLSADASEREVWQAGSSIRQCPQTLSFAPGIFDGVPVPRTMFLDVVDVSCAMELF